MLMALGPQESRETQETKESKKTKEPKKPAIMGLFHVLSPIVEHVFWHACLFAEIGRLGAVLGHSVRHAHGRLTRPSLRTTSVLKIRAFVPDFNPLPRTADACQLPGLCALCHACHNALRAHASGLRLPRNTCLSAELAAPHGALPGQKERTRTQTSSCLAALKDRLMRPLIGLSLRHGQRSTRGSVDIDWEKRQ